MSTAPHAPAPIGRTRWWTSARLQVTAGITVTAAVVLGCVLLVAHQLLALSVERSANARVERETAEFVSFVREGTLPSTGRPSPTVAAILRAYLSQQYPEDELLLVGTAAGTPTQFVLSKNPAEQDPEFTPAVRAELENIGRTQGGPASGVLAGGHVRWGRVTVQGPLGISSLVAAVGTTSAEAGTSRVIGQLTIAAGIGLLLTAFMAWLLARRMLAPVRRIREAADTISADDLSRRVPTGGPDEIAALAHTVNAMLARVQAAYSTQREFLDDAGHELRTPLTVVQGNLDLLPEEPAERRETLRLVQDELTRMTRIVEDLLTLARSSRPDFLRPEPTDLAELALDVELKIEVTADREWMVRPDAEGSALLDAQRITQALLQFCANAVRFTRAGDRIEIGCTVLEPGAVGGPVAAAGEPAVRAEGRSVLWWVRDTGPGIPPGQQESIFERFRTARGQLRDGRGGTGLGLAIVSTIARAHGGRAFVYNAEGGGACFCMLIPLVPAPAADPDPDRTT